jgi:hypothetical protein
LLREAPSDADQDEVTDENGGVSLIGMRRLDVSSGRLELVLITPGEGEQRLTRARYSVISGGEKSAAIHLPLFAAANALYFSAMPTARASRVAHHRGG